MCIIGYYAPGVLPVREHLEEAVIANPHGFGWAIVTYDAECPILIGHTMDRKEAVEEFMRLRAEFPQHAALFHARITTHGTTSLDNCHPFKVNGRSDLVLAHNGMVPCSPRPGDTRSDTRILADNVLMTSFRHLDSPKTRRRFEDWMGYSKVVILTTDMKFYECQSYIFNEGLGVWDDESGIWYSNDSYKPYRSSFKRGGATAGWDEFDGWEYDAKGYDSEGYGSGWYARYVADVKRKEAAAAQALEAGRWPTTVGGTSRKTETLVYLHKGPAGCGQQYRNCVCAGHIVMTPVDLLAVGDQHEFWECQLCHFFGMINPETLVCDICDGCFACDLPAGGCDCPKELEGIESAFDSLKEGSEDTSRAIADAIASLPPIRAHVVE